MQVIKDSKQHLFFLTQEQIDKVKEALTFDNPAYKQAKRYGRSKYIGIPPYLTYYLESSFMMENGRKKCLSIPIGVDVYKLLNIPFTLDSVRDDRSEVNVTFPPFLLELRKDQEKAETEYMYEVCKKEYPKSIIQLPTGKGKSILALHIAQRLGQKTLILVHKDDLVVGWQKDIKLCFGDDIEIGLIKAKSRKVGKQITIATVQTLSRMGEEELNNFINEFGFVVQDECHHVGLNIFNVIDKFNSRYKLGLSATPKRSDGLNFVFDLFFNGLCYKHVVTNDDEDICGCEVRVLDSNYKYLPFVHKNQAFNYFDFDEEELPDDLVFLQDIEYEKRPRIPFLTLDDHAVRSPKTKVIVCSKIIEHYKQGHSIIALFTQKEHIDLYYRHLCRYIPKEKIMLYYGDSKEKSDVMMKKAESKEVLVTLATYAKAVEGTNVKSWEVEFLVSSLNNEKNVEQATGRIRRRKEGKIDPAIVYDVRYSGCYSLKSHYNSRFSVYKRLKYTVFDKNSVSTTKKRSMFTRGYN